MCNELHTSVELFRRTLKRCEVPEMFCGLTKLHLTSHQHVSEGMMTELSCVGELFL